MKYKCIIFDCDGVLVDSEATTIGVVVKMAKEFLDYEMDWDEAMELFTGASLHYCFDYMEEKSGKKLPENKLELFRTRTFDAYRKNLQAVPGVEEVLKLLNVPICVASNAPVEKIELNLGILNLKHYFEGHFFSAYDVQKWKPEPDLFIYAAQKMKFKIEDCAVIEDSIAGVKAALAGGFDVYVIAGKNNTKILSELGANVFEKMSDLPKLLGIN